MKENAIWLNQWYNLNYNNTAMETRLVNPIKKILRKAVPEYHRAYFIFELNEVLPDDMSALIWQEVKGETEN